MNKSLEKGILLSLSFLLTTNYAISAALPQMQAFYAGMPLHRVDLLISVPSFGIIIAILGNIFFGKYLRQSTVISLGLSLFTVAGVSCLLCQAYPFVLCARFLQGLGSGMVNVHAISILSERYDGQERSLLLGWRSSVEAFGSALLTFIAGLLLVFGWSRTFIIYFAGIPVLLLYLYLVAKSPRTSPAAGAEQAQTPAFTGKMLFFCVTNALVCALSICSNTALCMRLASFVISKGMGSDTLASTVLSGMVLCPVLFGLVYGKLSVWLKQWFQPVLLLLSAVSMLGACLADSLWLLTASALAFGFFFSGVPIMGFQRIAERLPLSMVNRGTSIAVIGCNLGAFLSTYVIKLAAGFSDRLEAPIVLLAGVNLVVMVIFILLNLRKKEA